MDVRRTVNALKDVITTIARLLLFRLTWTRRDLDYLPAGMGTFLNPAVGSGSAVFPEQRTS